MAQTKLGAVKQARTMRRKYGKGVFKTIGREGGKVGRTGGFYYMKMNNPDRLAEIASEAGKLGKRGPEESIA